MTFSITRRRRNYTLAIHKFARWQRPWIRRHEYHSSVHYSFGPLLLIIDKNSY